MVDSIHKAALDLTKQLAEDTNISAEQSAELLYACEYYYRHDISNDKKLIGEKHVMSVLLYIFTKTKMRNENQTEDMAKEFIEILIQVDDIEEHCENINLPFEEIVIARDIAEGSEEEYGNNIQKLRKIVNQFRHWQKHFIVAGG